MGRILLADDEPEIRRAYERVLKRAQLDIVTACDGASALEAVRSQPFDAIVSDISMPGLTGLQLLRAVRERDLDVPVILMTGGSALRIATEAVQYGATRVLLKPVESSLLIQTVQRAVGLYNLARLKRQALELMGAEDKLLGDSAALTNCFERAISSLWMAFQPIVDCKERRIYAYEALLRSDEPAMSKPELMLSAAERLGRVTEIGRMIRAAVARAASQAPGDALIFVNLRAEDLEDEQLWSATSPLSQLARRVVLEITERTSIERVPHLGDRVEMLRRLGFRIAVDDLGAGYAGLSTLAMIEPELVKLDMSLVRDVDTNATKRDIVVSMSELCGQLGMRVIVEGVETPGERDVLLAAKCDLMQGFYFARPGRGFGDVRFD
ncbi:MAG TPA: EAL domain-containing protein [Polyangia bacterium]|nr:EAL domain-containing protein [Polyangia bacterium]